MFTARRAAGWLTFSIVLLFLLSACGSTATGSGNTSSASSVINVVAAENFYGNIVKQLGGAMSRLQVLSLIQMLIRTSTNPMCQLV